jgi:hypothetical protein
MSATIILAKDSSGHIIHIEDVVRSKSETFFCAGCGMSIIAVKSDARKKDWHFRHPSSSDIAKCRNRALHDLAVQILTENSRIKISKNLQIEYCNPRKEVTFLKRRSDVTVDWCGVDVHFEVFVTHDSEPEKLSDYRDHKIKAILIDLSDRNLRSASVEAIKEKILNHTSNKRIIYWEEPSVAAEKLWINWKYVLLFIGLLLGIRFIYCLLFINKRRR